MVREGYGQIVLGPILRPSDCGEMPNVLKQMSTSSTLGEMI